jgi:hypothetical protein
MIETDYTHRGQLHSKIINTPELPNHLGDVVSPASLKGISNNWFFVTLAKAGVLEN